PIRWIFPHILSEEVHVINQQVADSACFELPRGCATQAGWNVKWGGLGLVRERRPSAGVRPNLNLYIRFGRARLLEVHFIQFLRFPKIDLEKHTRRHRLPAGPPRGIRVIEGLLHFPSVWPCA